ncbi:unnamed protein product [marine sediment metagenome]|uniref:Uncharacterized protein n=1 Tax=marine sediment metagenome TaxID=412755 RepID=X1KS06_9ZZZZ
MSDFEKITHITLYDMEKVITLSEGDTIVARYEIISSEDGTRYTALVIPVGHRFSLQMLGAVDEGYLVICGLNRLSYLFKKHGYLDVNYIMEKFRMNLCDGENFITLLKEMMPTRTF